MRMHEIAQTVMVVQEGCSTFNENVYNYFKHIAKEQNLINWSNEGSDCL